MYEQINKRLEELYHQFERGNIKLMRMERERTELRETLFRIQGAVQVLKEMSGQDNQQISSPELFGETAEVCVPVSLDEQALEDE